MVGAIFRLSFLNPFAQREWGEGPERKNLVLTLLAQRVLDDKRGTPTAPSGPERLSSKREEPALSIKQKRGDPSALPRRA